jgi:phosphatidylethanolamine-binding protein (PEBP) family uncharacterized protein
MFSTKCLVAKRKNICSGFNGTLTYTADMRQPYPPSISPDDDVFRHLATVYASTHPTMHLGYPCNNVDREFEGGITNGAAWYPLTGEHISRQTVLFVS